MANIYTSADQLIGKTPLLELTNIEKKFGLKAKILAKLERAGAVETAAGKYICQNETILHYPTTYSESQLLDIIGMTQNTVNGQAVFSGVPPMSISSRGSSGV